MSSNPQPAFLAELNQLSIEFPEFADLLQTFAETVSQNDAAEIAAKLQELENE